MKKILLVGAIVLVALAALGVAGFAYAQSQTPPTPEFPFGPDAEGWHGGRRGMMGAWRAGGAWEDGIHGPMHEYMLNAIAEALGLEPQELQVYHDEGKTPWDVAQEQGLSEEEFRELMFEARKKALEQAAADGVITQEQADWMLERMNQMWEYGPGFGPCHGGGGTFGGRPGGGPGGGRWSPQPPDPET